jgi:kynurenine formamidase
MTMHKIILEGTEWQVIDLMKPYSLDMEVYPGDPKPVRKVFTDIRKEGWQHYIHEIADHHFQPHADAPKHSNPDEQDKGIEFFGPEYVFNEAFMIDLTENGVLTSHNGIAFLLEITPGHLSPFEPLFKEKGAVILRTGYDRYLESNQPHDVSLLPYLTKEAAEYIASFDNLKVIGTDSLTVDPPESNFAHRLFSKKLLVEALVNLHEIPKKNRHGFTLQTAPLKITGASGAPVTAYAFVKI